MKLKRVDWYPDCVRIVTAQESGTAYMDQSLTHHDAARLLAGLEVALATALLAARRGKCLHCGAIEDCGADGWSIRDLDCGAVCHCSACGGVLSPAPTAREGE